MGWLWQTPETHGTHSHPPILLQQPPTSACRFLGMESRSWSMVFLRGLRLRACIQTCSAQSRFILKLGVKFPGKLSQTSLPYWLWLRLPTFTLRTGTSKMIRLALYMIGSLGCEQQGNAKMAKSIHWNQLYPINQDKFENMEYHHTQLKFDCFAEYTRLTMQTLRYILFFKTGICSRRGTPYLLHVLKNDGFTISWSPLAKNWTAEEIETPLYV